MILVYRPIRIWPDGWDRSDRYTARWSPFKADWRSTLDLLSLELAHLGTDEAQLQLDVTEAECRIDGGLRHNARVGYHGVILSFDTIDHGTLTYSCNAFDDHRDAWRQNVRAIALGLHDLRRLERYGIAKRGQQYAGWAELPSGIALGAAMTIEEAARFIADLIPDTDWGSEVAADPLFALALFKDAAKVHHPDQGGDPDTLRRLMEARQILEGATAA